MSDRLKLTLFAMLAVRDQPRDRVLDLYSGTGALAIEALSRGAESADVVERNAGMCQIIRANLAHTKLTDAVKVHNQSVGSFLNGHRTGPYDLIIMDPPYADPGIAATVEAIGEGGLLAPDGLLVLGHSSRREFPERIDGLVLDTKRCHGDSCISLYIRETASPIS